MRHHRAEFYIEATVRGQQRIARDLRAHLAITTTSFCNHSAIIVFPGHSAVIVLTWDE
jgi:hypothetical protein